MLLRGVLFDQNSQDGVSSLASTINNAFAFFDTLYNDPSINQQLTNNHIIHHNHLINNDLNQIHNNNLLITQLFSTNSLTFAIHNIQSIFNILKYSQLLETVTMYNLNFLDLTKTCHQLR